MEFKGQYLSYDEYKELKGTLEQVPFNLLEYDIRKKIDKRTFGRLTNEVIPYEVKICVFKMISIYKKYKPIEEQNIAVSSENTDGYSVSYRKQEKSDIDNKNNELDDVITTYLSNVIVDGVPVLYPGVDK